MAITVKIDGMSCSHCVMAVKKELSKLPGVKSLDVQMGKATIDGDVDVDMVKKAIDEAGYEVVGVE